MPSLQGKLELDGGGSQYLVRSAMQGLGRGGRRARREKPPVSVQALQLALLELGQFHRLRSMEPVQRSALELLASCLCL